MKSLATILLGCLLTVPSAPAHATELLLQVVVDDSGILHDERDGRGKSNFNAFLREFFGALARAHRRDRQDTTVRIISARTPPATVWSGFASDFAREGLKSPSMIQLFDSPPAGCNDIPTAIDEALVNKTMIGAERNALYLITSGVHAGPACEGLSQEQYVKLVETIDEKMTAKIASVSDAFDPLSIQFLAATQRRLIAQKHGGNGLHSLHSQGEAPKVE